MKKLLIILLIPLLFTSCWGKILDIKKEVTLKSLDIAVEKAKERTVFVLDGNDTILNYKTTSDTIVVKLKN